jgi:transcriptional regulator with XRE-family HTH domain
MKPNVLNEEASLGLYLQMARQKEKLTLKEVAQTLNVTYQQVQNWEREVILPPLRYIKALATLYQISDRTIRMKCAQLKIARIKKKYGFA